MFILIRALVWASLFVAFALVFLPSRILGPSGITAPARFGASQAVGSSLVVAGGALVLASILSFVFVGRGTAAPFDPPRRLVTTGPFAVVRNPIYIGALTSLAGAALYYHSVGLAGYGATVAIALHLVVLIYEEPTLRRLFGPDYAAYCARVSRWWPRLPARGAV